MSVPCELWPCVDAINMLFAKDPPLSGIVPDACAHAYVDVHDQIGMSYE